MPSKKLLLPVLTLLFILLNVCTVFAKDKEPVNEYTQQQATQKAIQKLLTHAIIKHSWEIYYAGDPEKKAQENNQPSLGDILNADGTLNKVLMAALMPMVIA